MNRTVATFLCLAAVQAMACTPYKRSYSPGSRTAGTGDGTGKVGVATPGTGGVQTNGGQPTGPATDLPTVFNLGADKFAGNEAKFEVQVKYAGIASDRVKLVSDGKTATFSLTGLPADTADTVVVEVYEGENMRFIAKRAATQLKRGEENKIAIEDCQILNAPWDGKTHDGSCSWSIEEVTN